MHTQPLSSYMQASYKSSLFELQLRKQAVSLGLSPNQAPPELRTQIRERLQFRLRQLNLPYEGTNVELRQRLRDAELAATGLFPTVKKFNCSARELSAQGLLTLDETEDWMALRQKVLGYYASELEQRGLKSDGNLAERKERLRYSVDGALPAEKKDKKVVKKKAPKKK